MIYVHQTREIMALLPKENSDRCELPPRDARPQINDTDKQPRHFICILLQIKAKVNIPSMYVSHQCDAMPSVQTRESFEACRGHHAHKGRCRRSWQPVPAAGPRRDTAFITQEIAS